MKKLISTLLVGSLFLGFTTNVFAATETSLTEDEKLAQVTQMITDTNIAIDAKIASAVEQADGLQKYYLNEIRILEQSEITKLTDEKVKLETAIKTGKYSKVDVNEMERKIVELDEKVVLISQQLEINITSITEDIEAFMATVGPEVTPTNEALYKAIQDLTTQLNRKSSKYVSLTDYYTKKLNAVITDCYDVTLAMSNEAIAKAAENGIEAEASWKLVRFGHLWVWIDPIRIIGRH